MRRKGYANGPSAVFLKYVYILKDKERLGILNLERPQRHDIYIPV